MCGFRLRFESVAFSQSVVCDYKSKNWLRIFFFIFMKRIMEVETFLCEKDTKKREEESVLLNSVNLKILDGLV